MRHPLTRCTVLGALALSSSGCSNGRGDPAPARINNSPTILAPPEVTGAFPVYDAEVPVDAATAITFAAIDPDGDAVQWRAQLLIGDATAGGLTFPTESTGSLTFTIATVPAAALLIVAMTMADGHTEATAFLTLSRTASRQPTLTTITPDSAYLSQPQAVTLRGAGFVANDAGTNIVTIGSNPATGVVTVADDRLDCATPITTVTGPADVELTNSNGAAAPLDDAVTYFTFPPRWQAVPSPAGSPGTQFAALARDGSVLYYAAASPGLGGSVFFGRSTDRGVTWTQQVLRSGGAAVVGLRIAATAGRVHVAWVDGPIRVRSSLDQGATFRSAVIVGTQLRTAALELSASGDAVCALVEGLTEGLMVTRSTDSGLSWSEPVDLTDRRSARLAVAGNRVHVAGADTSIEGIYYNHSVDGGASWQPIDTRLANGGRSCSIAANGTDVFVAWAGRDNLFVAHSPDGGRTFDLVTFPAPPVGNRVARFDDQNAPALTLDGGVANVAACWLEPLTSNSGISVARILPGEIPTRAEAPGPEAAALQLAVSGHYRHLAWSSGAVGSTRVLTSSWTIGNGGRWLNPQGVATGGTNETGPVLVADSARLFIAWNEGTGALVARSVTQ